MFAANMKKIIGEEMAAERDELERRIRALELKKIRVSESEANSDTSDGDVPATSYGKWGGYEDAEELESEIGDSRRDLAKLNEKMKNRDADVPKACGHACRCSCSGDKSAERKVMAMNTSERLERMAALRREGNVLHGRKQYRRSLALYETSLLHFEHCFDGTRGERRRADAHRPHGLLNAAACFLRLRSYSRCIEYCGEALEIDAGSGKAWFRRAKAHRPRGKFDAAEKDLSRARDCSGAADENVAGLEHDIHGERNLLRDDKKRHDESSNALATSMVRGTLSRVPDSRQHALRTNGFGDQ